MENDEIIRLMDNVGLAMILAYEKLLGEGSQWNEYLNLLPVRYTTPIYYNIEQLQVSFFNILFIFKALKPSSVFEEALNMYRAVARQFVYFYLRILGDYNSVEHKVCVVKF